MQGRHFADRATLPACLLGLCNGSLVQKMSLVVGTASGAEDGGGETGVYSLEEGLFSHVIICLGQGLPNLMTAVGSHMEDHLL